MTDEEKISRRYRELPREEPPRHLDDAILAAARRAVHTRPAPLVVPSGRQRWYFPLAAAAIIVLAVAVTMHMEREQPADEVLSTAPPREMAREELPAKAEEPKAAPQPGRQRRDAPAAGSRELRDSAPASQTPEAPAAAPAPSHDALSNSGSSAIRGSAETKPAPAPESAAAPASRPQATVQAAPPPRADEMRRESSALAKLASRPPEQWLQGIADLRQQGRHEEADKELAEFRRRYPDYKIPEAMREKVEKR